MSIRKSDWSWNPQKNAKLWQMYLTDIPEMKKRLAALEKIVKGPSPEDGIMLAMRTMFHSG